MPLTENKKKEKKKKSCLLSLFLLCGSDENENESNSYRVAYAVYLVLKTPCFKRCPEEKLQCT